MVRPGLEWRCHEDIYYSGTLLKGVEALATTRISTGVDLYYEWHGTADGPPVVFVRGTGADSSRWLPQVADYESRYRCLIFDNRGSGKSESPPGPYDVAMMAEDTIALLDTLEVDACHLSGLSLGGAIAMNIAIEHPERVTTLQLHGTWAKTHGYAQMYLSLLKRFVEAGGLDLYYEGALLYLFPPEYITDQYNEVTQALERMKANSSPVEGLMGQLEANLTHDELDRLHQISAPTLVTVGELDMCLPPLFSREVADAIPNAELVVFPGGSHLFGLQDPETFNSTTLDWLARQEAATTPS